MIYLWIISSRYFAVPSIPRRSAYRISSIGLFVAHDRRARLNIAYLSLEILLYTSTFRGFGNPGNIDVARGPCRPSNF